MHRRLRMRAATGRLLQEFDRARFKVGGHAHFLSKSINAIAAAGLRSLSALMKNRKTSRCGAFGAAPPSFGRSSGSPPCAQVRERFAHAFRSVGEYPVFNALC